MLNEEKIADLLYQFPWLLDSRYIISELNGNQGKGRRVKIGRDELNREIELLFKDTRDNRPVIVEINDSVLTGEHIARMLEYRSLVNSMDENLKLQWQTEFGHNYFAPKLLLIGTGAGEEVTISANLAGIDIRLIKGRKSLAINLDAVEQISDKLAKWTHFINSGNRTLMDRQKWVHDIFHKIKSFIDNYEGDELTTVNSLCTTNLKNSYVRSQVFPFINIPIRYQDKELLGFYEYYSDELCFDENYIYCDFVIEHSYYIANKEEAMVNDLVVRAQQVLKEMGYDVIVFDSGMATIKIDREILEKDDEFFRLLDKLVKDALRLQKQIEQ
ncbi:MAG TPA: hypothetical protein VHQ70_07105 [Syntrophomonadaceae bacterium]|nr:hypothetical protein [Syntrophomonadaceae bacterium]